MADKYLSDSTSRLKPDSSNYREWCVKTRAKINQQKLGKYLNKVNLVTLQLQMSKLEWSERTGLEAFADEFLEFMRKLSAAGDTAADKAHLNHFLCLLPPRFANTVMYNTRERRITTAYDSMPPILAELKLDDERQKLHNPNLAKRTNTMDDAHNVTTTKTQEISITQAGGIVKTYRHETDEDKSGGPKELEDEIDEVTADLANYATTLSDDEDERPLTQNRCDCGQRRNVPGDEIIRHDAIACKRGVRLADGHPISVTTVGDVRMKSKDTGRTVVFCNVLLVPNLTKTLISISRITDSADAASILFKQDY
ncbi:hypothetical protein DYB30_011005 [Aphanomyces astaci]|uniref:Retrovirus-related Pol polyprotein from transposon TNT 1-94-like beta-barrel domain-containing protein n=1 Tax=Aphanomyces astaci TaxID=112090 RepID=A0A397DP42_APHAT|nr:hypothetical protein DYB30_011005 [Aphanomyces astaci]